MNIYEIAIMMEKDGEEFYLEQAEKNKNNALSRIFLLLAKDEKRHAEILKNKFEGMDYKMQKNETPVKMKNFFSSDKEFISEMERLPKQLSVYRQALLNENKSIELYKSLLIRAEDLVTKKLFEYLTQQENEHSELLEEIILLVSRPDEWVESAEFGLREEY